MDLVAVTKPQSSNNHRILTGRETYFPLENKYICFLDLFLQLLYNNLLCYEIFEVVVFSLLLVATHTVLLFYNCCNLWDFYLIVVIMRVISNSCYLSNSVCFNLCVF